MPSADSVRVTVLYGGTWHPSSHTLAQSGNMGWTESLFSMMTASVPSYNHGGDLYVLVPLDEQDKHGILN